MNEDDVARIKLQKLKLLEEQMLLREGLPFKFGFKKYEWQDRYCINKTNKKRFICAANQIGKSTIQICDRLDIATSPELWPKLYPEQFAHSAGIKPYSWYLYPNQDTVLSEFYEKWEPCYLPRGKFKDHPVYGWKPTITNKVLKHVTFNSGWRIYFKTYNQNVHDLQSGTVWAVDCDEELPEPLLPELEARLFATSGYFSMAFTATLGQDIWRRTIQPNSKDEELFKDAFKLQVSMYNCTKYADGTQSGWTEARIKALEATLKDKREADRRIRGRFVLSKGLKYPSFDRERNYKPFPQLKNGKRFKGCPPGWSVYTAVDLGGGGEDAHPSAYVFLAVSPEYDKIRAFRMRRLEDYVTTAGDTYNFYKESRGKIQPVKQCYDFGAKDFGTIVDRVGDPFDKAVKDHAIGEMALETALKTGILVIYFDPEDPLDESRKLVGEFEGLLAETPKNKAKDDLIDALRYALVQIPIDWEAVIEGKVSETKEELKDGSPEKERPNDYFEKEEDGIFMQDEIDDELREWDSYLD